VVVVKRLLILMAGFGRMAAKDKGVLRERFAARRNLRVLALRPERADSILVG
jgi:hypothetical protein